MQRYALVDASGVVDNVVLWDGGEDWAPPSGFQAVQSDTAGIGWTYIGGTFSSPEPDLVDYLPTDDERDRNLRVRRHAALASTDWLVSRHQDETLFASKTTLTAEQAKQLGAYRQALRDLPSAEGFPHVELPTAPDFIEAK